MASEKELSLLSLYVYSASDDNTVSLPATSWVTLKDRTAGTDGFAYAVFRNTSTKEIVIAYRGTDTGVDWLTNVGLPVGLSTSQAIQAAQVYVQVLHDYDNDASGSNISFTGHSLGGGLASVMAVWFDRPAVAFDPAPFEEAARNGFLVNQVISSLGPTAPPEITSYIPADDFLERELAVSSYFAPGSIVYSLSTPDKTVTAPGKANPVRFGATLMTAPLSRIDMHSQALLSAGLIAPAFAQATIAVQRALPRLFDKNLYNLRADGSERNFLIDLIRSEQQRSGNGKLTHFAADLSKLGANLASLNAAAQDAIIAQAIEWYYWQSNNYSGQEFIDSTAGLLQYTTALGAELPSAESRANTYVTKWLDNFFAREAVLNNTKPTPSINPDDFAQWNVATASGSTSEARNQLKTQIFIGNDGTDEFTGGEFNDALWGGRGDDLLYGAMGADKLYGGTGQDELYGDEGDDRLEGGAGSDQLFGGAGDDTYVVGNGIDYIKDDEAGEGNVRTDKGVVFVGGVKERTNLWKSDDKTISYVFNEATGALIIVQQGFADAFTIIRDFDLKAAESGGYLGISLRDKDEDEDPPMVSPDVATGVTRGVGWFRPGDPLVLDLDGDGIELTSSNQSVLFDHDADTLKTGTQWVRSDDGMLVRDLNGNGAIDSGRELFGDQTRLSNGQTAANGFAALTPLDNNADGLITSADAAYSELRIWRDLNQDGVSQEGELQSLDSLGITAINLNANAQGTSSYTRTVTHADGTTSTVSRTVQNVNFQTNNFYREFTDDPEVTSSAAALPQMQGAGMVRDLRQAMSLGTQQATALEQSVATFKAATSAQARQNLLDQVINTWAATSGQADAKARNATTTGGWYNATVGDAMAAYAQAKPAEYAMMTALERFNGQCVLERYVRQRSAAYYEPTEQRWKGYTYYVVEIETPRLALFTEAYQALRASVYQSLYLQTAGAGNASTVCRRGRQERRHRVCAAGAKRPGQAGGTGNSDNPASTLATYKARIALDQQQLNSLHGQTLIVGAGMQVVAEVNQGQRTVLEYLLSPVSKAVQEAGREK